MEISNLLKHFMQLMRITLLVTSICEVRAQAQGSGAGNGGDAVVCSDGVYMLDSIESARRGFPISMETESESYAEKINLLIKRVGTKDQNIAREFEKRANELILNISQYEETGIEKQDLILFTDGQLVNVADEGATYIPTNCKIEQLIIQNKRPLPGDKKFLIQKDLWKQMSLNEKAAAIFHEAIYGYLLDNEIQSSPSTRYYNGIVISGEIVNTTDQSYYNLIKNLEFPLHKNIKRYEIEFKINNENNQSNLEFNEDGSLRKVHQAQVPELHIADGEIKLMKGNDPFPVFISNVSIYENRWESFNARSEEFLLNAKTLKDQQRLTTYSQGTGPGYNWKNFAIKNVKKEKFISAINEIKIKREMTGFSIHNLALSKLKRTFPFNGYVFNTRKMIKVSLELDEQFKIISINHR